MINRWQGNSGRVQRLPEKGDSYAAPGSPKPELRPRAQPGAALPSRPLSGLFTGLDGLKRLLPGKMEELETEDIILLLILYLMYRESGDSELLMIMGAMFLL